MRLNDSFGWENDMILEEMPAYNESRMRTAIVYDNLENMYMIVTPTYCTIAEFRTAILETLGNRRLVDGIYLDGDGSSQMLCRYVRLNGDQRQVYQMLTLIQ
ncbi:phosphodiester glycosidase family protein [Paenibacillus aceris]|nr:phosphodiester glycosidase family protein [Paenibacillus aceris]NHW36351.1 phosphodiester glycosidase family protein [Paenibacillus aceris]